MAVQVTADLARTIQDLEEVTKARAAARIAGSTALATDVENVISDAISQGVPEASLLSAIRSAVSWLLLKLGKREPTLFVIASPTDRAAIGRVCYGLRLAGVGEWRGLEPQPGQDIERELSAADFVLFFISPESVRRKWVLHELQVALSRQVSAEGGAVILPILLHDADVPPLLRQFRWVDLRDGDFERAVGELVPLIRAWTFVPNRS